MYGRCIGRRWPQKRSHGKQGINLSAAILPVPLSDKTSNEANYIHNYREKHDVKLIYSFACEVLAQCADRTEKPRSERLSSSPVSTG